MTEGPIARIVRESEVADLVEVLADRLPLTDLQSLLLEVYRRRASRVSPGELLARYERNRFVRPTALEPSAVAAFEELAWSLLPDGYAGLELSPLCPLGTNSAVATVDQNKVVTTVRNTEVVADVCNVLALECAVRRRRMLADRDTRNELVALAASHRQVRSQVFGDSRAWAHFRLLGLVAGGRSRGLLEFETAALRQHIGYLVRLLGRARPDWHVRVALTDLCGQPDVWDAGIGAALAEQFPDATFGMDPDRASGRGYYVDACYKVFATDGEGTETELGDGGCTTWTRQLLSDEKERLVIGGLGVERTLAP
ncbi:MAG TPA: hypothetical protein VG476_05395 [Acidimicrobiales bacterium]|nr:hypothetical protein [Acidimicrobiales bacterium]